MHSSSSKLQGYCKNIVVIVKIPSNLISFAVLCSRRPFNANFRSISIRQMDIGHLPTLSVDTTTLFISQIGSMLIATTHQMANGMHFHRCDFRVPQMANTSETASIYHLRWLYNLHIWLSFQFWQTHLTPKQLLLSSYPTGTPAPMRRVWWGIHDATVHRQTINDKSEHATHSTELLYLLKYLCSQDDATVFSNHHTSVTTTVCWSLCENFEHLNYS